MATTTTTTTKKQKTDLKATTPEVVEISKSEYVYSIIVLCLCVFANSYLMISVFPYSGYMAIALIDGVDQDNCGKYAGLLASFFMIGRAIMAVPYGQAADIYGRKVIMYLSLVSSTIFSLLFGLSPTFGFALFTRFLLGFSNGIFSTTKTMVSELANGNKQLETQGMGIVMGMWAFGILFSPAISGYLSDPVKQYPTLFDDSESSSYIFFVNFKFFLPNIFGSILCLLSIISVSFIKETLPETKIRPAKYLPSDIMIWFQRDVLAPCCSSGCCNKNTGDDDDDDNGDDEMTRLLKKKDDDLLTYNTNTSTSTPTKTDDNDDDNSDDEYELPSELLHFVEDDVEDAIRRSIITAASDGDCGEAGMLSKPTTRSSMISAVKRRASVVATEKRRRRSSVVTTTAAATITTTTTTTTAQEEERKGPSIGSVWEQINTRNHLIVYWIASFFMVAVDEGFPLYCISSSSGLGLSESTIGSVISASGFVYVFGQLFVYSAMLKCFGLYGTIRIGSFFFGFIVIMFPISQYINAMDDNDDDVNGNGDDTNDDDDDELSWGTFVFLAGILSIYRIFGVVFLSSTMVATNRTVVADVRATMNGLQTLGSSIVKGIAPIFAGLLVSLSFASGLFSPEVGSWFMWTVTSIFGVAGSIASCILLHDDDDDDL